jgi:hypothetical protein
MLVELGALLAPQPGDRGNVEYRRAPIVAGRGSFAIMQYWLLRGEDTPFYKERHHADFLFGMLRSITAWSKIEWRFQELEGIFLHILLHQTSKVNTDYGVWTLFANWSDKARTEWSTYTGLQLPEHHDSDAISVWLENKAQVITWSIRGLIQRHGKRLKVLRDGRLCRRWHGEDDEEGDEEDNGNGATGGSSEDQRPKSLDMLGKAGKWSEQEDSGTVNSC